MYVFLPLADGTFTVGFYSPSGRWNVESNHPSSDEAVGRMRYLNGAPLDDQPAGPAPATPAAHPASSAEKKK
jgi:hypothetical protein